MPKLKIKGWEEHSKITDNIHDAVRKGDFQKAKEDNGILWRVFLSDEMADILLFST